MFKKWSSWVGIVVVLGSEFLIRNVFLPEHANELHVRYAIIIEWLILFVLLLFWIPRVEKKSIESIGFGKFKWHHLWIGILGFVLATGALIISGIVLEANGLEPIRSLQPVLKTYSFSTLFGLFLTGTILEEVFYRGYLIERLGVTMAGRAYFVDSIYIGASQVFWFGAYHRCQYFISSPCLALSKGKKYLALYRGSWNKQCA